MHLGIDAFAGSWLWAAEIVCFLLSVFWRPTIGLYLLIPLLPLQTVRYRIHGYFLGEQFIDVLLLGVMLGLVRQRRISIPRTPLNTLLFVFIGYTFLSMARGSFFLGANLPLWFTDPRVSDWKNYVVDLALIFLLTASAVRTKGQMTIVILLACAGSLLVSKGFHNVIGDRDFSTFSYDLRDSGPLGWAGVNGLAAFAAQVGVFVVSLFLFERRISLRACYAATAASSIYCVVFALSRSGYAAFIVGIGFLGVMRSRTLLLAIVALLLMWQTVVPAAVGERIFMTTDENGQIEHSAAARMDLWDEAMQVFRADPIFGTGFNTYKYETHVGGYGDTHNLFVKALVETGLVGLSMFLLILLRLFRIGWRLYRTAIDPFYKAIGLGFAALMITAVIGNFFGDRWMYYQITGYTFAFAALAWRAQQLTDERTDSQLSEEAREMQDVLA
jgi:O-antigen ligase